MVRLRPSNQPGRDNQRLVAEIDRAFRRLLHDFEAHAHEHGNLGGGLLHAPATDSIAGFMSAADKTKLDSITPGAAALSDDPATQVQVQTAAAGTSDEASRGDHLHSIATGTPVAIHDSSNAAGTSTSLARSDHQHAHGDRGGGSLHALVTTSVAGFMSASDKTKLNGIDTGATADAPYTSTPEDVGATGSAGSAGQWSRGDHVHAHGDQGGGSLHAVATTSVAGFMSASDKTKLDAQSGGGTVTNSTLRWSGSAWVENPGMRATPNGDLTAGTTSTDAHRIIQVFAPNNRVVQIRAGDQDSDLAGALDYSHVSDTWAIRVDGVYQVRIGVGVIRPDANDGAALGSSSHRWSALWLNGDIGSSGTRMGTVFGTTGNFATANGSVTTGSGAAGSPGFIWNANPSADRNWMTLQIEGVNRWLLATGATTSSLIIKRRDTDGSAIDIPFAINASTGVVNLNETHPRTGGLNLGASGTRWGTVFGTTADFSGTGTFGDDVDVTGDVSATEIVSAGNGQTNGFKSGPLHMYGSGAEDAVISSEVDEHLLLVGDPGDPRLNIATRAIVRGTLTVRAHGSGFGPGVVRSDLQEQRSGIGTTPITLATLATLSSGLNVTFSVHVTGVDSTFPNRFVSYRFDGVAYHDGSSVTVHLWSNHVHRTGSLWGIEGEFSVVASGSDVILRVVATVAGGSGGPYTANLAARWDLQVGGHAS